MDQNYSDTEKEDPRYEKYVNLARLYSNNKCYIMFLTWQRNSKCFPHAASCMMLNKASAQKKKSIGKLTLGEFFFDSGLMNSKESPSDNRTCFPY